ncbi:unnamed protein product [Cyprideis torosa]|uniref:Arginyl-tRNA--protein transferase 1 n=1 Tax=Cyprideis torosa TaxID=163714 RepID=A0A7R8WAL4_9CRUS|nr:unnamed protein product [Cyprideis torosa]CAG0886473.1 unnamed protein product [Cyprideis torosa]
MWAYVLTVHDYQDLVDRGWRRSGSYCYKPDMPHMCCPSYTIRCEVSSFRPSKSQRKVLKRLNRFLLVGGGREATASKDGSSEAAPRGGDKEEGGAGEHVRAERASEWSFNHSLMEVDDDDGREGTTQIDCPHSGEGDSSDKTKKTLPPRGKGPDPSLPRCGKAKQIRRQRKIQKKQQQHGMSSGGPPTVLASQDTSLFRELIDYPVLQNHEDLRHRLSFRMVPSGSLLCPDASKPSPTENKQPTEMCMMEHKVYQAYQCAVHGDAPSKCSLEQFKRFLVESPLVPEQKDDVDFGSFHHQYWLDENRLVAVAVLDVLPHCVSSVYFFYDPEFSFLSLGTYSAMKEIALTQDLMKRSPELRYYYMGFYIHSCVKMRYKGQYTPSYLLCPETYTWHRIENCRPLLDNSKYCRLNPNPSVRDLIDFGLQDVLVLYRRRGMKYGSYKRILGEEAAEDEDEEVKFYLNLVGARPARNMLLFRPSD